MKDIWEEQKTGEPCPEAKDMAVFKVSVQLKRVYDIGMYHLDKEQRNKLGVSLDSYDWFTERLTKEIVVDELQCDSIVINRGSKAEEVGIYDPDAQIVEIELMD